MMSSMKVPIVKDLVLLGGGHSHVEVLRSFGMRPMPGVRVTLVTRDVHTPYSGMLPGYISGFYDYDDCHIDLERRVLFRNRPPLAYDVLSVDIGITPDSQGVPGAREHTVPVKPIDRFVHHLDQLLARHAAATHPLRVVVVGGGAGGVEVALALQHRLEAERRKAGLPDAMAVQVSLVCRGVLLAGHTQYARSALSSILRARGVAVHEGTEVVQVAPGELHTRATGTHGATSTPPHAAPTVGQPLEFDECLWCTQASAASWIKATGLPTTDGGGFIRISDTLQAEGGPPEVFAAGDVATCTRHPRPKAGVFAVRQGPPLAANLRAFLAGQALQPFVPQTTFLSLITTGDKYCIATKGWVGLQGGYLWGLKDWIDRSFMKKYGDDLPAMAMDGPAPMPATSGPPGAPPPALAAAGPEALALLAASKMRCGGCGSKVGSSVLTRALRRLREATGSPQPPPGAESAVVTGLDAPDDAAVLRPPGPGKLLLQTVDFFDSFWDDPYVFGQLAATHALGDVWAMGGCPTAALAIATVPLMSDAATEEELFTLLAGAQKVLSAAGCELVGGHTSEGAALGLGFSVTGEVAAAGLLRKGGLLPGQALVLTKALGTGVVMAGHMRGVARGRWVTAALESMVQPSGKAAAVLAQHGATAATDVTGFGLAGHLLEMLRPSRAAAEVDWGALPLLPGAANMLARGVLSSIHPANAKAAAAIANFDELQKAQPQLWPILMDPQTSGGLLAGVPADAADECVQALHMAGYPHACIIGHVTNAPSLAVASQDAQSAACAIDRVGSVPLLVVAGLGKGAM